MSTVKSRRAEFSEATRAALLEAATSRFAERGFAGTSLEDVAADIRASRGAVYHHFGNKQALFEAVLEELETSQVRRAAEAAARASDPVQGAVDALETFLDRCCDPVYGRIVWQEGPIALGWARWEECEEKFAYGIVEQLVRDLMDSGHIEHMPVEPTTRITFGVLGTAGQALAGASQSDKSRLRAEYSSVIRRLLRGLLLT